MSKAVIEIGGIQIGTGTENISQGSTPTKLPFHALILGNFSGHNHQTISLEPTNIDRDNFSEKMISIDPTLTLYPTENQSHPVVLSFKELEDFEPDFLFESLSIFEDLRSLRRKLANNATFESAAKEMNAWQTISPQKAETTSPAYEPTPDNNKNLLDSLLTETERQQSARITHASDNLAQSLIQQVVAPYIIPGTHPRQAELLATVDNSISGLMNTLLHHPDFQALESSWRNLYLSVRKIKTNAKLKLFFCSVSKDKLIAESNDHDLKTSLVYKKLIEPYTDITGGIAWSLVVGDYYFDDKAEDILLLEKLGLLARQCIATFVAGATPSLVNCHDLGETPDVDDWDQNREKKYIQAWELLRTLPQSANLALTFPRILTRLPYGEKTKSVDNFSFEEMKGSEHNNYLWGNSAYCILFLIADAFEQHSWDFIPGENNEIGNLPAHSFEQDGEQDLKPCAEIYLTEKGAERLLENGLLPVWSILRSDSVRVGPFSSLHTNNQRIKGRWKS